jgi:hypothetical protein
MVVKIPFIVEGRFTGLLLMIAMFAITLYYMRKVKLPFVRRVPALDAIEEGIGRAAEMGRPVIASPGIAITGIDYWTVGALSILTHVATLCARNDLRLLVPLGGSEQSYTLVEISRDIVENQYRLEGNPERYNVDDLPFLSGRQFAWASAYCGMLMRDKPALNVMVGEQWGSAIYIAGVSHEAGSFTISGSDYLSNVACLAVASDYVMIGEEMVAAGAYLSKDPVQIASIRTQDIIKAVMAILLLLGILTLTMGSDIVKVIINT